MIKEWEDQGGEGWQLIEPVDGFHPGQVSGQIFYYPKTKVPSAYSLTECMLVH